MCGQASISISEAMELSPRELHWYLNGAGQVALEMNKTMWETGRLVSFYSAAPYFDKKKGKMTMDKFLPLPWDKKQEVTPISLEEFKRIDKAWQENQQLHS